jgi:serine/threonine-protein kinase
MLAPVVLLLVPAVWGGLENEFGPRVPDDTDTAVPEEECAPPEPGFLTLDTAPWTMVYVDGEYAGSTPLFRHKMAPGPHTLTLVNDAHEVRRSEDVVIEEGRARKLKVLLINETETALDHSRDLSADETECIIPEDEAAWLTVDTAPWSQVFLDGKLLGDTPIFEARVARGDHAVRFVRGDGGQAFARFHVGAGETVKLSFSLE